MPWPKRRENSIPIERCYRFRIANSAGRSGARWTNRPRTGALSPARKPPKARRMSSSSSSMMPDLAARKLRRRDPHPDPDAGPADGVDVQRVPRDRRLLANACRDADRPESPSRGHGRHRRVSGAVPRLHRHATAQLHRAASHLEGKRLHHRRLRQVAHDAGPRDGTGRPLRALAAGLGL